MKLEEKYQIALNMIAEWAVAIDVNGAQWDDWDEYYKDAMYRPTPIREDIDEEMLRVRKYMDPQKYDEC